jgi:predicted N-acetyltransferase YhbS
MVIIRELFEEDAAACVQAVTTVGWHSTEARMRMVLRIGVGLGAELDGALVGTVFLNRFGTQLSSIATMVVDPKVQRQGIGKRLMAAALARVEDATVFLYATEFGKPLYAHLGFVDAGETQRMMGAAPAKIADPVPGLRAMEPSDLPAVCALDEEAHGAPRHALLAALWQESDRATVVSRAGEIVAFGLSWVVEDRRTLSPIIAREPADARAVAQHLSAGTQEKLMLDLDSSEKVLRAWAAEIGLTFESAAGRMVLGGAALPGNRRLIRALAGRAYG